MKRTAASLMAICAIAPALALAQAAPPAAKAPPAAQLQRVPVSGLHIGPPSHMKNPYEGDKQAWMQGKKLFKAMNCSGCHAPGGGGGMGPPLSDNHWIYGGSPGQIYLSILHGRPNGMPQWGTTLPPQAIWELVTYVETLSHSNPAEPKTTLGSKSGPGNTPHPTAKLQPPPLPKHPKPPPQPPKPAHPSTTAGH